MLRRAAQIAIIALLAAPGLGGRTPAQGLPRGQIIPSVPCVADVTQSYALYVPSTYTPDRPWTVLMGFHPGANGRAIVETYRDAAERYGYLVAGSNNSRNGLPWDVITRAAQAMLQDLGQRFAVNGARVYLTGHSGGSRVALQIALTTAQIAGVIASSAGYPDGRPRASVRFPIVGTAGTDDFNYIEMRMLDRALKTPHRLVVFEGGHTLPPGDVAMQAVEWLELQSMASGIRPRDEALIDQLWAHQDRAVSAAGASAAAVTLLRAMAADFKPFRDVTALDARASALAKQQAIKQALDRERDSDTAEARLLDAFARYESGLQDDTLRVESVMKLRSLLADLNKRATAPQDSLERARSRRVLRVVTMGTAQRTQDPDYLKLLEQYRLPGSGRGGSMAATLAGKTITVTSRTCARRRVAITPLHHVWYTMV